MWLGLSFLPAGARGDPHGDADVARGKFFRPWGPNSTRGPGQGGLGTLMQFHHYGF